MTSKEHSRKVANESAEKQDKNPYQCDNCGQTFTSESEKHKHEKAEHPGAGESGEKTRHAG